MPRMITDIVAGVVMYGNFIAFGYVPKEEQSDRGEKYYIQITAPNLNSYKARLTDEAYQQFQQCLQKLGDNAPPFFPVLMNVSYSLFNGQVYWRAERNLSPCARIISLRLLVCPPTPRRMPRRTRPPMSNRLPVLVLGRWANDGCH